MTERVIHTPNLHTSPQKKEKKGPDKTENLKKNRIKVVKRCRKTNGE